MSLVSTFVDAFKKAAGKNPKDDVDMKSVGPMGSVPEGSRGSFDPLRPAPESDAGKGIDHGDASPAGGAAASADPEEGGEVSRPSKGIDHGDVPTGGNPGVASGDPEEGGEAHRP